MMLPFVMDRPLPAHFTPAWHQARSRITFQSSHEQDLFFGGTTTPKPPKAGPNDCDGALSHDSKYSLIGDRSGCTIPLGTATTFTLDADPGLAALADNGGPTQTHLPLPKPLVLSMLPNLKHGIHVDTGCEMQDQRGVPRPRRYGTCDMGAVEVTRATGRVTGFVLVNATSDNDIRPLNQGDTLVLADLPPQLSVRAEVQGSTDGVIFDFDASQSMATDIETPYSLGGDTAGNYLPFVLAPGHHRLTATPFTSRGRALEGTSQMIDFTVLDVRNASDNWGIGHIEIKRPSNNLTLVSPTIPQLVFTQTQVSNLLVRTNEGTPNQRDVLGLTPLNPDTVMAPLGIPLGTHTVTVSGDVSCWYCTGGNRPETVSRTFTLLPPAALCTRTDGALVRTIPSNGITVGQTHGRQTIMTQLQNGNDEVLILIDDAPDLQQNQMRVELDIRGLGEVEWNKAIEAWGSCRAGSRVDLAEASMASGGFGVGLICNSASPSNDFRTGCTNPQTITLNQSTTKELLLRKPGILGVWHDVEVFDSSIWPAWGGRSVRFIWWKD